MRVRRRERKYVNNKNKKEINGIRSDEPMFNTKAKHANNKKLMLRAIRGGGGDLSTWSNHSVLDKKSENRKKSKIGIVRRNVKNQKQIENTKKIIERGRLNRSHESLENDEKTKKGKSKPNIT